jgi:hypothetical protein
MGWDGVGVQAKSECFMNMAAFGYPTLMFRVLYFCEVGRVSEHQYDQHSVHKRRSSRCLSYAHERQECKFLLWHQADSL